MFKPRVALVVDQPQRDLAGMVLTAFDLCQRGISCFLVPTLLQRNEIWAFAPDFVLLFNLRRGFEQFVRQLISANIRFGLLDVEGAAWESCDKYAELLVQDQSLLRRLSCACIWGPRMAEYLMGRDILLPHQSRITGCPRFDFYHPKWRNVLHEPGDNHSSYGKRILINTNSAEANPGQTTLKGSRTYLQRFGWSPQRINEFLETQSRQIEQTIELAQNLARDYPKEKIVLRPHPFEAPAPYQRRLGEVGNIEINTNGPVLPQIFTAAAVIQRSCTTAIESALASVPTFSPRWIATAAQVDIAENVSTPCFSYSDLRRELDLVLRDSASDSRGNGDSRDGAGKEIHDWFYLMDGEAHRRVSNAIADCLPEDRVVDAGTCSRHLHRLEDSPKGSREYVSRALRHKLRLPPDWSFRQMKRVPASSSRWLKSRYYFGVSQVADLTARIERTARERGGECKPVNVELAVGLHGFSGGTITMSC